MKIENVKKKFIVDELYICPKCRKEAIISDISLVCQNNHRYDFSKKGYIHLINNYKSTKYSENLFISREYIFNNGYYNHILEKIKYYLEKYSADIVLDIGCGEGYYINKLKKIFPRKYFYGIDNSKEAVELAVKKDKVNPYMLVNLSTLPFKDNSISCILNILTPANYREFSRVLKKDGYIIKVIPTKNYLKEIRDLIDKSVYSNTDTTDLLEKYMEVVERDIVSEKFLLDKKDAKNILNMTPLMFSEKITEDMIAKLKQITIELEIIVCKSK